VHLLPLLGDVVDEAVVEEEHGVEAGRLVVAYVAVRAEDGVRVVYARLVEASNREADGVVCVGFRVKRRRAGRCCRDP
jgi:hypothetical protein